VDRGEPRRPGELPAPARRAAGAPGRAGRQGPSGHDALDPALTEARPAGNGPPVLKATASLAAAAVCVALLGGCGGGKDPKERFVERGNAICKQAAQQGQQELANALQSTSDLPALERGAAALKAGVRVSARAVERLRKLRAPSGDEQEVAAIFKAWDVGLRRFKFALAHDSVLEQVVSGNEDPFSRFRQHLTAYGLNECAGEK
jgi:hypothetical protein